MTGNITITLGKDDPNNPTDGEVHIDGNKIGGLVKVGFELGSDLMPRGGLEIEPAGLSYEGDLHELIGRFAPSDIPIRDDRVRELMKVWEDSE